MVISYNQFCFPWLFDKTNFVPLGYLIKPILCFWLFDITSSGILSLMYTCSVVMVVVVMMAVWIWLGILLLFRLIRQNCQEHFVKSPRVGWKFLYLVRGFLFRMCQLNPFVIILCLLVCVWIASCLINKWFVLSPLQCLLVHLLCLVPLFLSCLVLPSSLLLLLFRLLCIPTRWVLLLLLRMVLLILLFLSLFVGSVKNWCKR